MKTQLLMIAALLAPLGVGAVHAQDFSRSTSTLGREEFADRNAQELRQIRAQVDQLAQRSSQTSDSRLTPLYDALSDAEDALAAWKIAGPLDVTQRRADYDRARNKLMSLWSEFRTTAGATGTS